MSDWDIYTPPNSPLDFGSEFEDKPIEPAPIWPDPRPADAVPLSFVAFPVKTDMDSIRSFIENNQHSYILVPTNETGILRLNRNVKSGYRVALLQTLKDSLK